MMAATERGEIAWATRTAEIVGCGVVDIASGGRLPAARKPAGAIPGMDVMAQRTANLIGPMFTPTPTRLTTITNMALPGRDFGE